MTRTKRLFVLLLLGSPCAAASGDPTASAYPVAAPLEQYLIADTQAEIALARSAAPASISANAEILVLGKHGYETAVPGRNGFVCFVERSWAAGFDDPEFWNPKLRAPNCFNPPAARSVLPQYRKRSEWVIARLDRAQIVERARAEFNHRRFTAPEPGSLTFMLSKQGYLSDEAAGPWLPHLMLFVASEGAAIWGAGLEGSPILGSPGKAYEPTVLLIPVRRWSDGSPAPPPESDHRHGS